MGSGQILDSALPNANFPYTPVTQYTGGDGSQYTYAGPTIGGISMPGRWLLTRCTRSMGVEAVAANYQSGGVIKFVGVKPMELEYQVDIWESGTMGVWRSLLATLLKRPGIVVPGGVVPAAAALPISDPAVNDMGVKSVVVAEVEQMKNPLVTSGGKGPWSGRVKLLQWLPLTPMPPFESQDYPATAAYGTTAAANLATAQASITAGANALQAAAAQRLIPPPGG